jgi:hypothetical protein
MADRKEFSPGVIERTLLRSARVCPLCYWFDGDGSAKWDGQIAHLDRDHSNAEEANAVYLCARHHNSYDSRSSQFKQIAPAELRHWRDKVYNGVESGILPSAPNLPFPVVLLRHVPTTDQSFAIAQLANASEHSGHLVGLRLEAAGRAYEWSGERTIQPHEEIHRHKLNYAGPADKLEGVRYSITVADLDRRAQKTFQGTLTHGNPLKG